jgi:hypothetical protein
VPSCLLIFSFHYVKWNPFQWLKNRKCDYAPSSSLLLGKHLPFTPSPLRLNIFRLFVILSLTQLYRYTPEIFLFKLKKRCFKNQMSVIWSWTYFYNPHWNNYFYFKGLLYIWEEMIMVALIWSREFRMTSDTTERQALVSFKKYMPPPLPYFKVNICLFPLPHFASIFFAYLWSFRWQGAYIFWMKQVSVVEMQCLNHQNKNCEIDLCYIFAK